MLTRVLEASAELVYTIIEDIAETGYRYYHQDRLFQQSK